MNKIMMDGRLVADPIIRTSKGNEPMKIARYRLAVQRRNANKAKEGEQTADFIDCVMFGRQAEFAEKYLKKGTKMLVTGRIQTGSYTNKEGVKVYTTEVVVEEQEFAESKSAASRTASSPNTIPSTATGSSQVVSMKPAAGNGFIPIPDGVGLPFTA